MSHLETNLFSSIFWKLLNFNIKIQDQSSSNLPFRNDTSNLGEVDHYFVSNLIYTLYLNIILMFFFYLFFSYNLLLYLPAWKTTSAWTFVPLTKLQGKEEHPKISTLTGDGPALQGTYDDCIESAMKSTAKTYTATKSDHTFDIQLNYNVTLVGNSCSCTCVFE